MEAGIGRIPYQNSSNMPHSDIDTTGMVYTGPQNAGQNIGLEGGIRYGQQREFNIRNNKPV